MGYYGKYAESTTIEDYQDTKIIRGTFDEGDSLYLATILYKKADKENIRDANIVEIDIFYEPNEWELSKMNCDYDENNEG